MLAVGCALVSAFLGNQIGQFTQVLFKLTTPSLNYCGLSVFVWTDH